MQKIDYAFYLKNKMKTVKSAKKQVSQGVSELIS